MLVTFTNLSVSPVYVGMLWMSLIPGQVVTTRRSYADLDRDINFKILVQSGQVGLAFTKESGDDANIGMTHEIPSFTNLNRPAASAVVTFSEIFNTDDNAPNWSDGANWRDSSGAIT
jgi:hypothetical protein